MANICKPRDTVDQYNAQFFIDDARKGNPARTPERYKNWLVNVVLCSFANRMRYQYGMRNFSMDEFRRMHLSTDWYSAIKEQWDDIEGANGITYIKFHITKYDSSNGKKRGVALSMHKENGTDVLPEMRFLCDNFSGFLELYKKEGILDYHTVKSFDTHIPGITSG
jgi:hypothetical protein